MAIIPSLAVLVVAVLGCLLGLGGGGTVDQAQGRGSRARGD